VQIARHMGAEVTGVCAGPRVEFVKSLGAARVIDYTREDYTQTGESYDLIFDILGKGSYSRLQRLLKPGGRYLLASFKLKQLLQMFWTHRFGSKKVICAMAPGSAEDLRAVTEMIEAGQIKALIDRRYPMAQAAAAHRYVEEGHRKGHVVITMN
jgi:NADPH:quinone reductase-like Zn-dependent oxidoreductase